MRKVDDTGKGKDCALPVMTHAYVKSKHDTSDNFCNVFTAKRNFSNLFTNFASGTKVFTKLNLLQGDLLPLNTVDYES